MLRSLDDLEITAEETDTNDGLREILRQEVGRFTAAAEAVAAEAAAAQREEMVPPRPQRTRRQAKPPPPDELAAVEAEAQAAIRQRAHPWPLGRDRDVQDPLEEEEDASERWSAGPGSSRWVD